MPAIRPGRILSNEEGNLFSLARQLTSQAVKGKT